MEPAEFKEEDYLAPTAVGFLDCKLCTPRQLYEFGKLVKSKSGKTRYLVFPFHDKIEITSEFYQHIETMIEQPDDYLKNYPLNEEDHNLILLSTSDKPPLTTWSDCPHFGENTGNTWQGQGLEGQLRSFREQVVFPKINIRVTTMEKENEVDLYLVFCPRHSRMLDGTVLKGNWGEPKYTFSAYNRNEKIVIPMFPIKMIASQLANYPSATNHVIQIFSYLQVLLKGKQVNIHVYSSSHLIQMYSYCQAINYVFQSSEGFENWALYDHVLDTKFRYSNKHKATRGYQIWKHDFPFEIRRQIEDLTKKIESER